MPVTVNGGMVMPAWYDIMEMEIDRRVDTEGLISSAAMIEQFVDRELERGLDEKNIIIAGFSQGGAVAELTDQPWLRYMQLSRRLRLLEQTDPGRELDGP